MSKVKKYFKNIFIKNLDKYGRTEDFADAAAKELTANIAEITALLLLEERTDLDEYSLRAISYSNHPDYRSNVWMVQIKKGKGRYSSLTFKDGNVIYLSSKKDAEKFIDVIKKNAKDEHENG